MDFWGYHPATDFCEWEKKQQLCETPKGSACLGLLQCTLEAIANKGNRMSDDTASSSCQNSAVKHFLSSLCGCPLGVCYAYVI